MNARATISLVSQSFNDFTKEPEYHVVEEGGRILYRPTGTVKSGSACIKACETWLKNSGYTGDGGIPQEFWTIASK